MTAANGVDEARAELRDTLDRSETWLRAIAAVPETPTEWPHDVERDADTVKRLRTRVASTLINVALLGAFSSGKSFLLSGLQGSLELVRVSTGDGLSADKFVGLLPSSPVPTTACPASVVPVDEGSPFDASGTGYLRVRFADSDDWENVGNSQALAVVAAYATQDANVTDRLRAHRDREVAEIEILLSGSKLPAKLYDLPGYGSPNPIHDIIVRTAMADADCFIYVSHASRSLSENDLDLIRFLYEHYMLSRKRVVWVVTAIDSAMHLDHQNIPAWQATIARNNAYLRENFVLPDGEPHLGFIGEGFIPVSAALEAHAAKFAAEGAEASARRHAAQSRMDSLRQVLADLITRETGIRHIAAVAAEARSLAAPRQRLLDERLQTERLPIDELKGLLDSQRARLRHLDEVIPGIRGELERGLENYVKRASRPFGRLAAHLHTTLDDEIKATDVRKPAKANQVHVAKIQTLHAWIEAPTGPATIWTEQFARFKEDVLRVVGSALGDSDPAGRLPDYTFDVNDLTVPRPERRRTTGQDLVQRTAAVVGVATPLAAGVSSLSGAAAAATVFPPAGLIVGAAAAVYAGIQYRKSKTTSLEVMQEEWIRALDAEVSNIQEQFEMAIDAQGRDIIDHLIDNLGQYREQLEQSGELLQQRIAHPENQGRQELVDQLEPLCEEGRRLVATLRTLEAL